MNIVFMGTPDFAVSALDSLYGSGYNIQLVITQQDKPRGRGKKLKYTPVKEKALELGLEVFQPANINNEDSVEKIKKLNPDFIVVVAYGQILKTNILNIPKYNCLNIHASILPKYRGAAPINWAIIHGEKETGITIMDMDKGLDTGDILLFEKIPIDENDDYLTIHNKLTKIGSKLIVNAIDDIINERIDPTKQDDSLSNYAPMIYKDTGKIDWNKSKEEIFNLVRGLQPRPGAYTIYNGEKVKIHKVECVDTSEEGENGKITQVSKDGVYVKVNNGTIIIKELQFPGKKKLSVRDYLAGNKIDEEIVLK